jgi:hypothetical protein
VAKPKDKQPWFKFYPQDWRGDAKLRMCSIGARGLWAEMLCVMHEAEPYGYLVISDRPVSARQMAALAGVSQGECMKYMLELASAGVYSIDDDKTIFSRRMVRDKAKADKDRENGKGGGNPRLKGFDNGGVNPPDNGKDKAQKLEAKFQKPAAAEARSLDENGRKQEGALKAVFVGICTSAYRQPPDMSIIATWLLDGIAPATISTTVPPILKRKTDMLSLVYCDAAVREAHAKASTPSLQVVSSKPYFVEVGTLQWTVHQQEAKRLTGRGTPITEQKDEMGAPTGRTGWYFDKPIPDGFDEQTGERIPPANSEVSAA